MGMISHIFELYQKYNYDLADPRTNDFSLISSPFKVLAIIGLYLWFCLKPGPFFMKDRKPFTLNKVLIVYNTFQVVTSAYFFSVFLPYWLYQYSWTCEPVDYSFSANAIFLTKTAHNYFLLKIIELLDTLFFVLRKKYSQVTTLHVYHHSVMVFMTWLGTKYFAGGQSTFFACLNTFVHIIMYSYYLITCFGPQYQKYLKWKKQLTILQLAQFVLILLHSVRSLHYDCGFPKILVYLSIVQAITFIYMFSSFYVNTYIKSKKTDRGTANAMATSDKNNTSKKCI